MKPILYPASETEFVSQGLGVLSDAISCTVTEERNGLYELEMEYPIDGQHFYDITDRCIIFAIPSPYRNPQPFRIYRTTKPINGKCTICARHIRYDLAGVPVKPFSASNAPGAMAGLQTNAAISSPFTFWTNKTTAADFSATVPSATSSLLGGQTGSILDVYGGEYEFDKFAVKLYDQRGQDNGVTIRYGKNLTDLEQDRNIYNVATGIYPYWQSSDGSTLVTCNPAIVPAPGTYDFEKVVPVDFSQDFQDAPTSEQLLERAQAYVQSNNIGVPTVSLTVSFVQLEQTEQYKNLALLEKCDLCDTVTVQYEKLGVSAKAKIVKIVTNVLLERYDSVEIGEVRTNIADTIASQQGQINQKPSVGAVQGIANAIAQAIIGAKGGAVRLLDTNGDGEPDTLYIADNPDPAQAVKVWRFNYEGWGASTHGYNGPFEMGAALGVGLYADFITAGTLNCALLNVINLVAQGVQLTGDFKASNGNILARLWAASLAFSDAGNLRLKSYVGASDPTSGNILLYSGDVDSDGTMGENAYRTRVEPQYIECGGDRDGTPSGTVNAGYFNATKNISADGTISADGNVTAGGNVYIGGVLQLKNGQIRPNDGQNTLTVDWVRMKDASGTDYWVLGSRA